MLYSHPLLDRQYRLSPPPHASANAAPLKSGSDSKYYTLIMVYLESDPDGVDPDGVILGVECRRISGYSAKQSKFTPLPLGRDLRSKPYDG